MNLPIFVRSCKRVFALKCSNTIRSTRLVLYDLNRCLFVLSFKANALPDYERFQCPEALFQPSFVGLEMPGIHQLLYESINKTDMNLRKMFMGNIFLVGGSTLFPGFADRMYQEMTNLAPPNMKVRIISAPDRRYTAWYGGSILASLTTSAKMWITKQEYDECGPSIAFSKCVYM